MRYIRYSSFQVAQKEKQLFAISPVGIQELNYKNGGIENEQNSFKGAVNSAGLSMMLTAASCTKKGGKKGTGKSRSGQKIEADSPWYDYERFDVETGISNGDTEKISSSLFAGINDKYIVVRSNAYDPNDEAEGDDEDYLSVVDRSSGETINVIDLRKNLDPGVSVAYATLTGDKIRVLVDGFDEETNKSCIEEMSIDPATGETTDSVKMVPDKFLDYSRTFTAGDDIIRAAMNLGTWELSSHCR